MSARNYKIDIFSWAESRARFATRSGLCGWSFCKPHSRCSTSGKLPDHSTVPTKSNHKLQPFFVRYSLRCLPPSECNTSKVTPCMSAQSHYPTFCRYSATLLSPKHSRSPRFKSGEPSSRTCARRHIRLHHPVCDRSVARQILPIGLQKFDDEIFKQHLTREVRNEIRVVTGAISSKSVTLCFV
jgi:hypothetical protein